MPEEKLPIGQPADEQRISERVSSTISSEMSLEEIKRLVLGICLDSIPAERGYLGVFAQQEGPHGTTTTTRVFDKSPDSFPRSLRIVLFGFMERHQEPLLVNEASLDERFAGCEWAGMPVRSVLAVPLRLKGRLVGFISLFNKRTGGFNQADQKHLYLIGALSAQTIVSAQQVADYREDLHAAWIIQQNLLPKEMPRIPGFEVSAAMAPAKMVGGDYFDFLSFSDGRPAFAIADVAGKGLPAALLMANLQAIMRSQAVLASSCCECIVNANRMLLNLPVPEGRFITLFLALLDASTKRLFFCNAGHHPPILMRPDESFHKLCTGGRFLGVAGVSDEFPHDEGSVLLSGGDVLVIYSDGVTDASNEAAEQFGEKRLLENIRPLLGRPASEILSVLTENINRFVGKATAADDLTLMIIKAV